MCLLSQCGENSIWHIINSHNKPWDLWASKKKSSEVICLRHFSSELNFSVLYISFFFLNYLKCTVFVGLLIYITCIYLSTISLSRTEMKIIISDDNIWAHRKRVESRQLFVLAFWKRIIFSTWCLIEIGKAWKFIYFDIADSELM